MVVDVIAGCKSETDVTDGAFPYGRRISEALAGRRTQWSVAIDALGQQAGTVSRVAETLIGALRCGHKVLVAGNGGSAAEAQHFAAELVGRFKREREPYAVVALTTDTAILTAIANDYGYEDVFARQVAALGEAGDCFLAFSTSGASKNLLSAAEAACQRAVLVVAITGAAPNPLADRADLALTMPGPETAVVQEGHMLVTHLLCDLVEAELSGAATNGH